MIDDPYISKESISKAIGISVTAVSKNIEVLRGILIRRVGSDKTGFWEILVENRTETEKLIVKLTEKRHGLIEKLTEKATAKGIRLTENRIAMLNLMIDEPYISKEGISKAIGISVAAVSKNIDVLRGRLIRRVGSDKTGFWEIIE